MTGNCLFCTIGGSPALSEIKLVLLDRPKFMKLVITAAPQKMRIVIAIYWSAQFHLQLLRIDTTHAVDYLLQPAA